MAPTASKVATPGSLSKNEAVSLLLDQAAGFGAPDFQARLEDLRLRYFRAAPGKERNKLNAERSKLSLEVQGKVLPEYGFSADAKGVFQMWQAMLPYNLDPDWQRVAGMLNSVLGQDAQGQLLDQQRPAAPRSYSDGPQDTTSFRDGESNVSRFTAPQSLGGLFPYSLFAPLMYPRLHGDSIVGVWETGVAVLTLDLDVRWRWKVPGAMHAYPIGSKVCVASVEGVAYCFCLESGSELWHRRFVLATGAARTVATEAAGGLYLVPGYIEGTEPFGVNGIYALSLEDGSEVWRAFMGGGLDFCTPTLAAERVVIKDLFGSVSCLSLTTGTLLWYSPGAYGTDMCHPNMSAAAVSVKCGLACVCRTPVKEPSWNKVFGGKGVVAAFELESGRKRWEEAFDLEAFSCPIILAEKRLVVACLGNKCGPPEGLEGTKPGGDSYPGLIVGLSVRDGSRLWSWEPPVWTRPTVAGCDARRNSDLHTRVVPFTSPVAGSDNRIYTMFHSAVVYILDGATGKALGFQVMVYPAPQGESGTAVCVGENTLVLTSLCKTHVFRFPQPGPSIEKPLAVPFEESGVEHFFATKNSRNDHTLTCTSKGPVDLSKPAWAFESPCGQRCFPMNQNNFYCNPLIDAQRNIYNTTELGWLYVHRADGSLRGSVYIGLRATTPCISGTTLYAASADGYAHAIDLETLEIIWTCRYADLSSQDTWMPSVGTDVLLLGGTYTMGFLPHPILDPEARGKIPVEQWDNNLFVFGLDRKTGQVRWVFTPFWMVYNLNPTFVTYEGYELAIIIDNIGGLYFVNCENGDLVWKRDPTSFGTFHDICGVTMGPNKLIYFGTQEGKLPWDDLRNRGRFPQQAGILEAFDVSAFPPTKRWEAKFPFAGMLQSVVAPLADDKYVLILPMGENGGQPTILPNAPDSADTFQGIIYGLDPETGEELWSFSPPPWKTETGSCRSSRWWCGYLPASWCSPVVDGGGILHIYWHSGIMYSIEAATGRVKSSFDLGCCVTGSPAVAPGVLVIQAQFRVLVWRDEEMEEQWLAEAEKAGDPRAKVGRIGFGTSEEARKRGIAWGMNRFSKPPPEVDVEKVEQFARDTQEKKASPEAPAEAKPAEAKPEEAKEAKPAATAQPAEGGRRYTVVGGAKSGGISVRAGSSLKSEELGRLATGAEIRELEVAGDRIRFVKLSGDGPEKGWVSKSFKGSALLSPVAS